MFRVHRRHFQRIRLRSRPTTSFRFVEHEKVFFQTSKVIAVDKQRDSVRVLVRRWGLRASVRDRAERRHGLEAHEKRGDRGAELSRELQLLLVASLRASFPGKIGRYDFPQTAFGPNFCFTFGDQCLLHR